MNHVTKSIVLRVDAERAFRLFTEEMSAWWPPSRRHTGDEKSTLIVEPTGKFVERARNGVEVPLGRVREWSAPRRLVLEWYIGTDRDHATEVVVLFTDENGGCRVTVEHRPTSSTGELWEKRAPKFDESWSIVLDAFSTASQPDGRA